jgi:hypothetical protein
VETFFYNPKPEVETPKAHPGAGASVVLLATHVDCTSSEDADRQIAAVQVFIYPTTYMLCLSFHVFVLRLERFRGIQGVGFTLC